MVVVTSVKAARRTLRYESWHLIHLYAYLGVGLALPHQLWTGQEFLHSPATTLFWWALWARGRRRGAGLADRPAAVRAAPGTRSGSPRWCREGDGHRVGLRDRPAAGPAAAPRPGSSSPGASSPGPAGPGPTRTRSPRRRTGAACGSPSRTSATAARALAPFDRAPACWWRAPTAASAPAPAPVGRWRSSPPASASPRCGRWPRSSTTRPGDAVLLYRFTDKPLFDRELALLARERGLQVLMLPGHRRAPGLLARCGHRAGRRPRRAAVLGSRHRRARRLRLRPRAVGRGRPPHAEAAGLPPDRFHVESFGW